MANVTVSAPVVEIPRLYARQRAALWTVLSLYVVARLCQLWADRLPVLLVVILHVLPPAAFALIHGSILYRLKGMAVFSGFCLGVSAAFESFGLRTGLPFGHYWFTGVMGPQIMHLPLLLVGAYLGIGYVSWVLAVLIIGARGWLLSGINVVAVPVLASVVMTAWDLAMDPDWATLDHAWIWRDGGAYFGVPWSNYFGWVLTTYVFYQLFSLYLRTAGSSPAQVKDHFFWRSAIGLYAICAGGNLLLLWKPMAPSIVLDATGVSWRTATILAACAAVSLCVMGSFAAAAWFGLRAQEAAAGFGGIGTKPLK